MSKLFTFELVSPEKLLFSGDVEMVVVPGEEGNFGVLAEHSPLISMLRPGVLRVYENGQVTQKIFVAGGFAEVTQDRCTVLADMAIAVSDIDRQAGEQDLLRLNEEDNKITDQTEKRLMKARLEIAKAKLAAAA